VFLFNATTCCIMVVAIAQPAQALGTEILQRGRNNSDHVVQFSPPVVALKVIGFQETASVSLSKPQLSTRAAVQSRHL